MSTPDLEVIKEIPGYKVILKAILKSQIQQLVEQLAAHTEEESVILTASVSDGTLSHLGSDSGKSFLQDHEDVKSQFLGFCLKNHHKKKQEEDRLEALRNVAQAPAYSPRPRFTQTRSPRQMSPQSYRGRGARPEPYPVNRFRATRPPDTSQGSPTSAANFVPSMESGIKVESYDPQEDDNTSNQAESGMDPKSDNSFSALSNPSMATAQGSDSVGDSAFPESAGSNSDVSNMSGDRDVSQEGEDGTLIQDVKVESMLEGEGELEITGVEMGASQDPQGSSDSWAADMMGNIGFDTTGATGNQGDFQQGYMSHSLNERKADVEMEEKLFEDLSLKVEVTDNDNGLDTSSSRTPVPISSTSNKKQFTCKECQYVTTSSGNLSRHKRSIHLKEKINCTKCNKSFSSAYDLNEHVRVHHNKTKLLCEVCSELFNNRTTLARHRRVHHSGQNRFVCETCGKQYFERAAYIGHMNKHTGSRPFACTTCECTFRFKSNLNRHLQKTCPGEKGAQISPSSTGKKDVHVCETCGVVFNSKDSLIEHAKGKHGPKSLVCVCGKSFSWRPSFVRHKKKCKFANP